MTAINLCTSARTLGNPTPNHHHNHHRITFSMRNLLHGAQPPAKLPATTKVTDRLPFSKPVGLFPPNGGIPLPQSNPTIPTISSSTQTLDLSTIGFSFPTRATLQELEFGTVALIDEELLAGEGNELQKLGKAQGVYVASSEDGSSHMMAMTANLAKDGEVENGLRLFGVHRTDEFESHVAVIGGTGKFDGANGYASVKAVERIGSNAEGEVKGAIKLLVFDVYLS
ncbi:hypothetical protein L6164_005523 [Bauhinia variegata]|uniref:Uncharacterized protein n=1 Tax=Bauhinia variegata TaxID=167791 RepID=A0ACB9PWZ7_BAUVA|nr:hypothetical protein L6164_005523 [Bauhinia variegata]